MKRYRCIRTCYWQDQRFEIGDEYLCFSKKYEKDQMLEHFEGVPAEEESLIPDHAATALAPQPVEECEAQSEPFGKLKECPSPERLVQTTPKESQ